MIKDDKPPLDEALLKHFGVKGMRWGVKKTEIHDQAKAKTQQTLKRASLEYETAATVAGVALVGLAFANSPKAQAAMKLPTAIAVKYMRTKEHRQKVYRAIRKTGVLYSKI